MWVNLLLFLVVIIGTSKRLREEARRETWVEFEIGVKDEKIFSRICLFKTFLLLIKTSRIVSYVFESKEVL